MRQAKHAGGSRTSHVEPSASALRAAWASLRLMNKTAALALIVAFAALPAAAAPSGTNHEALVVGNGKIVFSQDAAIMQLDPDGRGRAQKIGRGFGPAWSPDGRTIALTDLISPTAQTLFVMDADGGNRRRLPIAAGGKWNVSNYAPAWSPDGTRLAFTRSVSTTRTDSGWRIDVYVVDLDGTNLRRLTSSGAAYGPTWSPDGRRIAYLGVVARRQLRRLAPAPRRQRRRQRRSHAPRRFTRDLGAGWTRAHLATCMVGRRSPDRVLSRNPLSSNRAALDRIRDLRDQPRRNRPPPADANDRQEAAAAGRRQHLAGLVTRRQADRLPQPSESRPGDECGRKRPPYGVPCAADRAVRRHQLAAGSVTRTGRAAVVALLAAVNTGAGGAGASPSEGRIAFLVRTDYRPAVSRIHVMDADGSDRRRLTRGRWDFELVWSPDGRRIAYDSDRIVCCSPGASRRWAIFVTSADGGPARS